MSAGDAPSPHRARSPYGLRLSLRASLLRASEDSPPACNNREVSENMQAKALRCGVSKAFPRSPRHEIIAEARKFLGF